MGMDPFNFAYSLIGVVAQRLARTLCKKCKKAHKMGHQDLSDLAIEYLQHDFVDGIDNKSRNKLIETTLENWKNSFGDGDGEVTTYRAVGCDSCDHSGYSGRIALHEVLANSDELRRMIRERASVSELQQSCVNGGMKTLKQDGITKFLHGDTDMLQVRKVCIT
jgi:type II secretory ATPase GspE/PulE/Tfp pilus assembly ATPase PilB-like protein